MKKKKTEQILRDFGTKSDLKVSKRPVSEGQTIEIHWKLGITNMGNNFIGFVLVKKVTLLN